MTVAESREKAGRGTLGGRLQFPQMGYSLYSTGHTCGVTVNQNGAMISENERQAMLAMVSPEAIRSRLLARRSLVVALLAGEDLLQQGVRPGGPEEMLAVLGVRAPLPELAPEEIAQWRAADPRHEQLYQSYLLAQP